MLSLAQEIFIRFQLLYPVLYYLVTIKFMAIALKQSNDVNNHTVSWCCTVFLTQGAVLLKV